MSVVFSVTCWLVAKSCEPLTASVERGELSGRDVLDLALGAGRADRERARRGPAREGVGRCRRSSCRHRRRRARHRIIADGDVAGIVGDRGRPDGDGILADGLGIRQRRIGMEILDAAAGADVVIVLTRVVIRQGPLFASPPGWWRRAASR